MSFSASDAAFEGFRMTRRSPMTVKPKRVRSCDSITVWPTSSESAPTITSAMPMSCARSLK